MMRFIRPRLRAPVSVAVLGTVAAVALAVTQGWSSAIPVEIVFAALAAGYYVWGGKDSDLGAVIGSRADERQASLEMKVTALQGKVMTAAVIVAFLIAVVVKATIWPFAVLVALAGISGLAGWAIYREHGNGQDDGVDAERAAPPSPSNLVHDRGPLD
jgi:hypothetical protein